MKANQSFARTALARKIMGICAGFSAAFVLASALPAQEDDVDLLELSLDDLLNLEVTSVSKKAQKITDAPAAIAVVTGDDVRKTGVTNLGDALRTVPGMQVGQIDSSTFAISSRGFNNEFANKLLVLIDGRSVYTPLFSGVYWDSQNVYLQDLARMEVIRGPGATVWGANAVNGVINVTTKSAKDTLGGHLYAGGGTLHEIMGGARYGFEVDANTHARVYAMYKQEGDFETADGVSGNDNWDVTQGGFRVDHANGESHLTWQGDIYSGSVNDGGTDIDGYNTLARWSRPVGTNGSIEIQGYYDHTARDDASLINNRRDTFDIEFQHNFLVAERHAIIWGAGYRNTVSKSESRDPMVVQVYKDKVYTNLYSAFIQDEIALVDGTTYLTIGSKFEQNDITGFDVQPSIRITHKPAENQTLWAAVSRAVRTPSEVEGVEAISLLIGGPRFIPEPVPGVYLPTLYGNHEAEDEELLAVEGGYRFQPAETVSVDVAVYYNDYDNLLTVQPNGVIVPGTPVGILEEQFQNLGSGKQYGAELAVTWFPVEKLQVTAAYAYIKSDLEGDDANAQQWAESMMADTPSHQFNARAYYDFAENWSLMGQVRFVDDVGEIPSYFEADLRLAFRPTPGLEVSVVGQNLLHDSHPEFRPGLGGALLEVPRSVHGRISWHF